VTEATNLRSWLFKGLAVENRLDELEASGVGVRASTDPGALQRVMRLEEFSGPIRANAMQALPAYLAFFCLENAVRELIADRLQENHGADWWKDTAPGAIQEKALKRQEAEGKDRWHTERGATPIHYTDFGDLKSIMTANWAEFADLFPDQNWMIARLTELEASRNIIAHSNVLEERELIRLRLYVQDWLRQVG
jgi:Swt1-like HEPN